MRTPKFDSPWLSLGPAAKALGISYSTLKQWIYQKKIRSTRTAGGHYRVAQSEIRRMTGQKTKLPPVRRTHSARNRLQGTIVSVAVEGLLAQVELDVGGQRVCAIITRDSALELGLKRGMPAAAVIKANEVMIARDEEG